jgi:hypothetical protein
MQGAHCLRPEPLSYWQGCMGGCIQGNNHMTDLVKVAIIAAVPGTLSALIGVLNHRNISQLNINVNGRLTDLLKLTEKSSKAEGVKEERDRTN